MVYLVHRMAKPGRLKINLLIVDNSPLIIERLLGILKEVKTVENFFAAYNYTGAVAVLVEKQIDVVLLDIQLPEKNGIDLLKHIVQHYPATRVVILSNLVSENYQRLCKKIGAVHYMDKSKDFDLIPELIDAL